ncbi:MAG: hypothetical protein KGI80_04700 [Verrucomicrobiota bacterium]|nr:hypothetical protein [Verrucomicrobiota bacterium]
MKISFPFEHVQSRLQQEEKNREKQLEEKIDLVFSSLLHAFSQVVERSEVVEGRIEALQNALKEKATLETEIIPQVLTDRDAAIQSLNHTYQQVITLFRTGKVPDSPIELFTIPTPFAVQPGTLEITHAQNSSVTHSFTPFHYTSLSEKITKYLNALQNNIDVQIINNRILRYKVKGLKIKFLEEKNIRWIHLMQLATGLDDELDLLHYNFIKIHNCLNRSYYPFKNKEEVLPKLPKLYADLPSSQSICRYGFLAHSKAYPSPHPLFRGPV